MYGYNVFINVTFRTSFDRKYNIILFVFFYYFCMKRAKSYIDHGYWNYEQQNHFFLGKPDWILGR